MFVDDLAIYMRGNDMEYIQHTLQTTLDNLTKWSNTNGLTFSPDKTFAVNFNRKRSMNNPRLSFQNHIVRFQEGTKWLGLNLDTRMTWRNHIEQTKSLRAMNVMKILSNRNWGLRRETLRKLYFALVSPILDYGSILYSSASQSNLNKLNVVHNSAIRLITGAFRTSPIVSILAESGIPPLSIRRSVLTLNYVCNVCRNPNNPAYTLLFHPSLGADISNPRYPKPLRTRVSEMDRYCELRPSSVAKLCTDDPPWLLRVPTVKYLTTTTKRNMINEEAIQHFREFRGQHTSHRFCFTDGSKTEHHTGAAFMLNNEIHKVRLNPMCSIFTAELTAIDMCLDELHRFLENNFCIQNFFICSDSKSSLQALQNLFHKSPLVNNITTKVQRISDMGTVVSFLWIPSHVGIRENNLVDEAARNSNDAPLSTICTADDYRAVFKKLQLEVWAKSWRENQLTGQKLKKIKCDTRKWKSSTRDIQVKAYNSTKILAQMSLNASTTSVLLNNLTSGAVYTARVVAYTRAGLGPYSAPVTLVMDPHAPPHALPSDSNNETWLMIALISFGSTVIFALGAVLYLKRRANTGKDCGHLSVPVVTAGDLSQLSMLGGGGKETLWIDRGWRGSGEKGDTQTKLLGGRVTECSDYAEVDSRNLSTFHQGPRKLYGANPTPYATTTLINGAPVDMSQPMFGASSSSETKTLSSNGSSVGNNQDGGLGPVYMEDRGGNAAPHWSEFMPPPPPQHPPPSRFCLAQQERGSEPRLLSQTGGNSSGPCGSPQLGRRAQSTTSTHSAPHRTGWHNYVPPPSEHPPPVPRSGAPGLRKAPGSGQMPPQGQHTGSQSVASEYDYESASLLYNPIQVPGSDRSTQSSLPHNQYHSGTRQDWINEDARMRYEESRGQYEDSRNYEDGRGNYEDSRGNYEDGRGKYEDGRNKYEDGRSKYEDNRSCSGSDTCCSCSESSCLYADPTHQVSVNYARE
ncbi:hypothetical protein M8J77_024546 [Diaphorina citri]|nr:hypothetical protein M8J77_024546 [Diaphorina citri]